MLRWIDGFDFYTTADLTIRYAAVGGGSTGMAPSSGRFSSGALSLNSSLGSANITQAFDPRATWFVGAAFYFPPFSPNPVTFIKLLDAGNSQLELGIDADSKMRITRNGTLLATGTTILTPGTFYYIEFGATIASSCGANSVVARLGGVVEVTVPTSTNCQATGNATASQVQIFRDGNFDGALIVDDLYICDSQGSTNNTFLGDARVETLYPSAAGNYTNFTLTGAGTNHAAVAEHPEDGDTSYVSSATPGTKESYAMDDLSTTPTAIFGAQPNVICRKDDAGSRAVAPMFRISSTDYVGASQGVQDTYTIKSQVYETNPATSAAWTATDINGAELGMEVVS